MRVFQPLLLAAIFSLSFLHLKASNSHEPPELKSYPFPQAILDPSLLAPYYPQIEQELLGEMALQDDARTRRHTIQYGYSFVKLEKGDFSWTPIPEFLQELGSAVCRALGHEPQVFDNIILSLYGEGFHLEPHADTNTIDFPHNVYTFGERIYGLIIESDPTGHLYFVHYEGGVTPPLNLEKIYEVDEQPGTVFSLEGEYRKAPYFHGVSDVCNRRLSITFRKVIPVKPRVTSSDS